MRIIRDIKSFLRFHFLYSAIETGLLEALRTPASKQDLIKRLHIQRPELFDALLALGVSLRELSNERGLYKLQGKRSLLLSVSDPVASLVQEYITYHSSVYRHLAARLTGAPLGDYLAVTSTLIARSSRTWEPFITHFMDELLRTDAPIKMLDVGCGSGIYLRHAAKANPQISGVGIDMQPEVVEQARANLSEWGIHDRFNVMLGDIRHPPADLVGPFDLITLYNNLYYFVPEERIALFSTLRSLLAPDGSLAIACSMMQGNHITTVDLDLMYRSTMGCSWLPTLNEIILELHDSGFRHVRKNKLLPVEPFYGIVATWQA